MQFKTCLLNPFKVPISQCQQPSTPIGQQLLDGVRFLDVRLRVVDDQLLSESPVNCRRMADWWRKHSLSWSFLPTIFPPRTFGRSPILPLLSSYWDHHPLSQRRISSISCFLFSSGVRRLQKPSGEILVLRRANTKAWWSQRKRDVNDEVQSG